MAQSVVVRKTDDIDGGEAVETVSFALDGRSYEIDLTAGNAEAFRRDCDGSDRADLSATGKADRG